MYYKCACLYVIFRKEYSLLIIVTDVFFNNQPRSHCKYVLIPLFTIECKCWHTLAHYRQISTAAYLIRSCGLVSTRRRTERDPTIPTRQNTCTRFPSPTHLLEGCRLKNNASIMRKSLLFILTYLIIQYKKELNINR